MDFTKVFRNNPNFHEQKTKLCYDFSFASYHENKKVKFLNLPCIFWWAKIFTLTRHRIISMHFHGLRLVSFFFYDDFWPKKSNSSVTFWDLNGKINFWKYCLKKYVVSWITAVYTNMLIHDARREPKRSTYYLMY